MMILLLSPGILVNAGEGMQAYIGGKRERGKIGKQFN
jgi:hypothetical protein